MEQQDHRATQLVKNTELALTNELNHTSESLGALKNALSYATETQQIQHEELHDAVHAGLEGKVEVKVQDRVDKYMHEELGKMRTGYLLDLESKMDSVIAGLHMPTQRSGERRAVSPDRHGSPTRYLDMPRTQLWDTQVAPALDAKNRIRALRKDIKRA
jgi:hypothetical protein